MRSKHRDRDVLRWLEQYESRNITFIDPAGGWPIVWDRARGMHVWDIHGTRYLDLTAAFGVAAAGHRHPEVVRAGTRQMNRLLHAMGDVHPHARKAELVRALSRVTFERWTRRFPARRRIKAKSILCNSGFEAVEAALKTALLASERRGVIAFTGAYHGLGYGALNATHRSHFRSRFRSQLGQFARFLPFPSSPDALNALEPVLKRAMHRHSIGAILVEPIQARGGIQVPPHGFLKLLRDTADEQKAVLILDEIYTGFGRTGNWFATEFENVIPDLVCLGKALTGGFPMSACVGRSDLMDSAWPPSDGEAIHTSTFLGHPVGCAMALAQIDVIAREHLVSRARHSGTALLNGLHCLADELNAAGRVRAAARGRGLMVGLELNEIDGSPASDLSIRVVQDMLARRVILLPEGASGNVLGLTPPLILSSKQSDQALTTLADSVSTLLEGR